LKNYMGQLWHLFGFWINKNSLGYRVKDI
jgi:hypothetical protein